MTTRLAFILYATSYRTPHQARCEQHSHGFSTAAALFFVLAACVEDGQRAQQASG